MPVTMPRKKKTDTESPADRHRFAPMSFRPPDELRKAIEDIAERDRRSVAQVLQFLVEEALTARRKKEDQT
jgi:hypothetical protein